MQIIPVLLFIVFPRLYRYHLVKVFSERLVHDIRVCSFLDIAIFCFLHDGSSSIESEYKFPQVFCQEVEIGGELHLLAVHEVLVVQLLI